jgi:ADP-ribose pyrophosphatase
MTQTLLTTRRFRVDRVAYPGGDGRLHEREVIRHPGAVTVLPLLADERVCLIRNYRPAIGATLIELPAGTREPNEEPAATAARELAEETGYVSTRIRRLAEFYLSPGILDERMHLFLATHLLPGEPRREAGEQIENLVVPVAEALQMVADGRIQDAKTIIGLLHYERWRPA